MLMLVSRFVVRNVEKHPNFELKEANLKMQGYKVIFDENSVRVTCFIRT